MSRRNTMICEMTRICSVGIEIAYDIAALRDNFERELKSEERLGMLSFEALEGTLKNVVDAIRELECLRKMIIDSPNNPN